MSILASIQADVDAAVAVAVATAAASGDADTIRRASRLQSQASIVRLAEKVVAPDGSTARASRAVPATAFVAAVNSGALSATPAKVTEPAVA